MFYHPNPLLTWQFSMRVSDCESRSTPPPKLKQPRSIKRPRGCAGNSFLTKLHYETQLRSSTDTAPYRSRSLLRLLVISPWEAYSASGIRPASQLQSHSLTTCA